MSSVRIRDVEYSTEDFRYRTPIKFGGVALDKVTILNVTMTVETDTLGLCREESPKHDPRRHDEHRHAHRARPRGIRIAG